MAAYATMMRRDRKREGLRECRAAWLLGVSVREYRELEAGTRSPTFETSDMQAVRMAADVRGGSVAAVAQGRMLVLLSG